MSTQLNSHDLPIGEFRTANDTVADGELQENLGQEAWHEHVNWGDTNNPKTKVDGRHCRTILTRNISGGTLGIRLQVDYGTTAGNYGIAVDGLTGDNEIGAGIVDPFLFGATTIKDDGIFNMFVEGPVDVENTADGTIAVGDLIVSAAAGQVNEQTAAPANETAVMQQVNSYVGRAEEAATNVAGTVFRVDYAVRG